MPRFAVIIPAGGKSTRFGEDKLLKPLAGTPVLLRSLDAFIRHEDVAMIYAATRARIAAPKVQCLPGGASRAQSVLNALRLVPASIEWIAVHDAARPLVSRSLIDRTFAAASSGYNSRPCPVSAWIRGKRSPPI